MKFIYLLLLTICYHHVHGAKILGIFHTGAKSHFFLANALMLGLAERGHDVTVISPFETKTQPKNGSYKTVLLSGVIEEAEAKMKNTDFFSMSDINPFLRAMFVTPKMNGFSESAIAHPNVQALLRSDEHFDVVIVEQFLNDGFKAFATHFKAPLIIFSTVGTNNWVNPLVANPSPYSYIPDLILTYPSQMTFSQRLMNTVFSTFYQILLNCHLYPKHEQWVQKYIPNPPNFKEALYNASLVLLNSHPSLNQPVPHVPSMVEIGGFHIKPPKPLPKDIEKFINEAEHGVIYFSMGSMLQSANLPVEKRDAILKVFSKLKQRILWKWESDEFPGISDNIMVRKWLPQQDILAHKNVKLFITHGGLLSSTETIYHGVPTLVIPVFGDQKANAQNAVNNGYAVSLAFKDLNEETFERSLNEILNNPKYAENAKWRSEIFHDRETKPMDLAGYWVEYVIRHKGAPHLRVAGLDLPWYKYMLLDVIAFLILVAALIIYINFIIARKIFRKFCRCKNTQKIKTN